MSVQYVHCLCKGLSFTVWLAFFHYVKPQHILQFHNKTTTTKTIMHFIGSTNIDTNFYTQCSLSFSSFYKSLQLIFGISATYRFVSYLLAGN